MLEDVKENARKTVEGLRETLQHQADAARQFMNGQSESYTKLARTYQDTVRKGVQETWNTFLSTQRQVAERMRENAHAWKDVVETLHETQRVVANEIKQNARTIREIWTPLLSRQEAGTKAEATGTKAEATGTKAEATGTKAEATGTKAEETEGETSN